MRIGNSSLPAGLLLAPMAGVADYAFRKICMHFGAEYVTSEMISAKAVCYNDSKTYLLAELHDDTRPAAIQLFGSDSTIMARAAYTLLRYRPQSIDINMGCPVHKIVNNGEGSALMTQPEKCGEVVNAVVKAVDIPVTVKIRSGFDSSHINAVEVAKICEQNGAAAIAVHGRTREMFYSGSADLDIISRVKQAVTVPVIGNGDITDGISAKNMLSRTKCDAVMVGRGALGCPWIFSEIKSTLTGKEYTPLTAAQKLEAIHMHIEYLLDNKGEAVAVRESRKHLAWYTKGCYGAASARERINRAASIRESLDIVDSVFMYEGV